MPNKFDISATNLNKSYFWLVATALLLPVIYLRNGIFPLDRIMNLGDSAQMVWNLWIVDYLLSLGKNPFVTDLAFWPVGVELTHHTLSSGYYPLVWLVRHMFGDQYITYAISYNLACWFSLSAVWYFTYKCLSRLSVPFIFAVITATAYTFSPFFRGVWMNLNHVSGFFLPLITFYILKIYQEDNPKNLYILAFFAGLSVYFTEFTAFFVMAIFVLIIECFFFKAFRDRVMYLLLNKSRLRHNVDAILLAGLITAPFSYEFLQSKISGYDLTEQVRYSINMAEYFFPGDNNSLIYPDWLISMGSFSSRDASSIRFLGYPSLVLFFLALIFSTMPVLYVGTGLFVFFLILGLGPELKVFDWHPHVTLPYRFIWEHGLLPGFRTPERFNVITVFILALMGGHGLTVTYFKVKRQSLLLANFIVVLFMIWVVVEPIRPVNTKRFWIPEQSLREVQEGPVLYLPHAMIHGYIGLSQIVHKQPTLTSAVVRYSQKMNDQWWKLNDAFKAGEQQTSIILKNYNVKNLILMPSTGLPPEMTLGMDQIVQTVAKNHEIRIVDARTPLVTFNGFEKANPVIDSLDKRTSGMKIDVKGRVFKNNQVVKVRQLEIVVINYGKPYRIEFMEDGKSKGAVLVPARNEQGTQFHIIELDHETQSGFNEVKIDVDGVGYVKGLNFRE